MFLCFLRQTSTTSIKRRLQWQEKGFDAGTFEKPSALGGPPLLKAKPAEPAPAGEEESASKRRKVEPEVSMTTPIGSRKITLKRVVPGGHGLDLNPK